jgi:hypothetical protein
MEDWAQFQEALRDAGSSGDPSAVYREFERRRQNRLAVQAFLTDFRLFWDALGSALEGREKMIIDADKVRGRRHLLLMDPDQLRAPVLVNPRRTNRLEPPDEGP